MRIGFFTETFYPQVNGVVRSLELFGEYLVKQGHDVYVFCPKTTVKEWKGMNIISFPSIPFRAYKGYYIGLPFRKIPPLDIVHTHGPFSLGLLGLSVAKRRKIPCVGTFHTLIPVYVRYFVEMGGKFLEKVAWSYVRGFYERHDAVVVPSHYMHNLLGLDAEVIPTGVDTKYFDKCAEDQDFFLYLGRVSPEKSIDLLIHVFSERGEKLKIAGKGPALNDLKKIASDNIEFLGYVPDYAVPKLYSSAKAFIMPSKTDTQGLVILEAMACWTPVIGRRATAIPEFVKPSHNGYLFDDEEDLHSILDRYKKTRKLSKAARKTAEKYDIGKMGKKLLALYESFY